MAETRKDFTAHKLDVCWNWFAVNLLSIFSDILFTRKIIAKHDYKIPGKDFTGKNVTENKSKQKDHIILRKYAKAMEGNSFFLEKLFSSASHCELFTPLAATQKIAPFTLSSTQM